MGWGWSEDGVVGVGGGVWEGGGRGTVARNGRKYIILENMLASFSGSAEKVGKLRRGRF